MIPPRPLEEIDTVSFLTLLALQVALVQSDTALHVELHFAPPVAPTAGYLMVTDGAAVPTADTTRHRAIQYSDWYTRRLTIHQWASWTMLPLSVAEYVVGQKLYNKPAGTQDGLRGTHQALATGIEALFAVNTVTGAWNFWDARHDPNDRPRRWIHSISMLVADAGFLAAAATAPGHDCTEGGGICPPNSQRASTHRTIALGAFGLSTASWLMMLLWKN
jgi:hypothetical protein